MPASCSDPSLCQQFPFVHLTTGDCGRPQKRKVAHMKLPVKEFAHMKLTVKEFAHMKLPVKKVAHMKLLKALQQAEHWVPVGVLEAAKLRLGETVRHFIPYHIVLS
ncbi:hypothetical protein CDAR_307911 [Caerostris darwini]|uniref:Uncharacterized protein n=1 Tax=Caerostris darwini TaxID=1538125 RepID=A0AAV4PGI6_9ARAC|nr:hypothetical protein CDAR_307911 [Caerostris darwini]